MAFVIYATFLLIICFQSFVCCHRGRWELFVRMISITLGQQRPSDGAVLFDAHPAVGTDYDRILHDQSGDILVGAIYCGFMRLLSAVKDQLRIISTAGSYIALLQSLAR